MRECVDKYLHGLYTINALIVKLNRKSGSNSNSNSSKNNNAFSGFSEIQFTVINVLLEKSSIEKQTATFSTSTERKLTYTHTK